MLGIVLSTLYVLTHLISDQCHDMGSIIIIPIL